jgi:glycosyltransferase involved in cell wall biosynthesis
MVRWWAGGGQGWRAKSGHLSRVEKVAMGAPRNDVESGQQRGPRTFATIAPPGTFLGEVAAGGTGLVVGRAVANTEFMRALVRWGSFDRFVFFVGEGGDVAALEQQFVASGILPRDRLELPHLLALPDVMAAGALDVLHLGALAGTMSDLVWLRDRYAPRALPITAQIHSLSYPRFLLDYLKAQLHPPGAGDAIICSSRAGRAAVEACFADAAAALGQLGADVPAPVCALPIVPLGVDVDRMQGGDRRRTRQRLGLPKDATVVLGIGRFTEYDKMDVFPLLQAFRAAGERIADRAARPYLLLAGARQGTKTPEMIQLWAKLLGIADRVVLDIDFPEAEKPHLLAAADVFVSPSDNLQETFGLSVIEAMAAGLPVVASDFDGYKDTVSDEVGIRVPTRMAATLDRIVETSTLLYERPLHLLLGQALEIDLPALENALHALVTDRGLRDRMAKNASARARANYDWKVVIGGYERLWNELAGDGSKRPPTRQLRGVHPPLAMRFDHVFASFPSGPVDPQRTLARTPLSRVLASGRNQYLIYPELRHVFGDADVLALLDQAERPVTVAALAAADGAARPQLAPWRRSHAIAWLIKHGLLG